MAIAAVVVATAVPVLFLALVRWLDLYASGSFRNVLVCFAWGSVVFFLALRANTFIAGIAGAAAVVALAGPVVEEVLKSLVLVYQVRRPDFTYFVDGAIYGFAAGIGFAVLENLLYLSPATGDTSLGAAFGRAFSTALMHGSATALVGISLGRLRYGRGVSRLASLLLGWAAAMALHIAFNNLLWLGPGPQTLLLAVGLGLAGLGLVVGFIFWGLAEERRWLRETLGLQVGVSAGESAVVQNLDDLDALLAPVAEHFGEAKRKQVEKFLRLQAQLGLKSKVQEMMPDPRQRNDVALQIAALRAEIDAARREVGVYCMAFVRSILPPETEPMWERLGQAVEGRPSGGGSNLWHSLNSKIDE